MVVINCNMLGSQQQMAKSCRWATVAPNRQRTSSCVWHRPITWGLPELPGSNLLLLPSPALEVQLCRGCWLADVAMSVHAVLLPSISVFHFSNPFCSNPFFV